ncbi:hypothetical protein AB2L27_10985 [Kineococcus sp. LSe6-4]|uniref:Acyl carrier protein n=1 Tax=Kineococcus halophytocola TaxID=3234027 RepID=A0ABV4H145_9ACTN
MQQQSRAIASWWRQVTPAARSELVTLGPGDPLSGPLTDDLRAFGVDVADVAVALELHGRTYRVHAQPPALTAFLAAARVWDQGWREPAA